MSLLDAAARAFEAARREAPGLGVEVYAVRGRERALERKEGRPEQWAESSEEGLGLRLFDAGRCAFVSAAGLAAEGAAALARRARAQLPLMPVDEARALPAPAAPDAAAAAALPPTLDDPDAFRAGLEALAPALEEAAARALRSDPRLKTVLHAGFSESASEVAVLSTAGVRAYERGSSAGVGFSFAARAAGELQVGSGSRSARRASDLDWDKAAAEAAAQAVSLLGAKKLPAKRRDVLFDPRVGPDLVDLLAGPMSAEAVQRGRSLLRGRLGKRVASKAVTLLDDPHRPGGLGSALYDDEGVPTRRKTMVEAGVLRDYYYDCYTAAREGKASNGSASRGGYRGLPGPAATNLVLVPGRMTRDELVADTADGILVYELMGMHTADPVTGELSVGVSGLLIRRGRVAGGVKGAMLSTNALELFKAVDAVADDLVCYGAIATPTFRAAGLQVS